MAIFFKTFLTSNVCYFFSERADESLLRSCVLWHLLTSLSAALKKPKKKTFSDIILDVSKHRCHLPKLTFVLLYFHVVFFCLSRTPAFRLKTADSFLCCQKPLWFFFFFWVSFHQQYFLNDFSVWICRLFRAVIVLLLRSARSHRDGRDR